MESEKDMVTKMLREQLDFARAQLEEKDKQIEHYKNLVQTLQELLVTVGKQQAPPQAPAIPRPPPGFETSVAGKTRIGKNLKSYSFHETKSTSTMSMSEPPRPPSLKASKEFMRHPKEEVPPPARKALNFQLGSDTVNGNKFLEQQLGGALPDMLSPADFETPIRGPSPIDGNFDRMRSPSIDSDSDLSSSLTFSPSPTLNPMMGSLSLNDPLSLGKIDKSADRRLRKSVSSYTENHNSLMSSSNSTTSSSGALNGERVSSSGSKVLKKSQSLTSVSTALEENRLDMKFPELDQMIGQIYALSKYQQGCRFLQKKLDENNPEHSQIIFNELHDHLVELMTDPFGNYLFTKLIEHATAEQKEKAIQRIVPDLMTVAVDMYGTQSLQKAMPYLDNSQIMAIINALRTHAITLVKHSKANYLIQYFLDHLAAEFTKWIFEAVAEQIEEVARDRVGCVIVKKCIDHATSDQQMKLVAEIISRALSLVQDPFGNYVVQHILYKVPNQADNLIRRLLGHLTDLCVQKFSSNVVEKCLQVASPDTRRVMLQEITQSEVLPQLLNDRFANFVIQTALDVSEVDQHKELVQKILPHLGKHYSPYSKHLQKKILKV